MIGALILSAALAAPAQAPARKKPRPAATGASTSANGPAHQPFPEVPEAPPPEHPLDITADHLTVLARENRALWKGNVHAVRAGEKGQPELHIRCNELTTTFKKESSDKQSIDTVTCEGQVEVVQGDRQGWGEKAVFDNLKGFLVVTGNPHGKQGSNSFKGSRLTFDVNSDRIDVDGANSTIEGKQGGLPVGGGKP